MDHLYGSPFYMINNGSSTWSAFQQLLTKETYQTDSLTGQWFSLVNKYAPNSDNYRKAIFQNTRNLLEKIPSQIKPERKGLIRVSTIEEGVDTCFLDIKCYGEGKALVHVLQDLLYKKFAKDGAMLYSRGGYGFYHPNIIKFLNGFDENVSYATLRVTLGIDPKDNERILSCLKEAYKFAKNLQKSNTFLASPLSQKTNDQGV